MLPRAYVSSKLFSLFGIVPLGVFVVCHLWSGMYTLLGPEAYDAQLAKWRAIPAREVWEVLVIGIPLVVHTVVGVRRLWAPLKPASVAYHLGYKHLRNLKFYLQRASGAGLGLFLLAHLWLATIKPRYFDGQAATFDHMSTHMHHPETFVVYSLGILGISYHLANGVWSFAISWGLAVSREGQHITEKVSLAVFALLLLMGTLTMVGLLMTH